MSFSVIYAARKTIVKVDQEDLKGVQSIEFTVTRNVIRRGSTGSDEAPAISYGKLEVLGKIKVLSSSPILDQKLLAEEVQPFQIMVQITTGEGQRVTITFHECVIESKQLEMEANNVAVSVYNFSATKVEIST